MTKKKALEISDTVRCAYLKKNRKLSKKAFGDKSHMWTEVFIDQVRKEFGYSPKTADIDIIRPWERVFKTIKTYT